MHAALERITVGNMDSIAGLQFPIWTELQKAQYKDNTAAQELIVAAEGARKNFDERRDKYDQLVRIKATLELAGEVLEGKRPYKSLSKADEKLLTIKVDDKPRALIKKTGSNLPELTEVGRTWALSIAERSQGLKSEATLAIDQSAKNSRENKRREQQRARKRGQHARQDAASTEHLTKASFNYDRAGRVLALSFF